MKLTIALVSLCLLATPALADWDPGDGHKMHYPQLPDPNGWDVDMTAPNILADDWQCSQSGPVTDVHFWFSWWQDLTWEIDSIHVSIHENIPDPDPTDPNTFSMPGQPLWERDFFMGEFTVRPYESGLQGFLIPPDEAYPEDHFETWQCNIVDIVDPFFQETNEIYWLDLSVNVPNPDARIGWKTSMSPQFMDNAVYFSAIGWQPLYEPPLFEESIDLAFVITPEPATLLLLSLGIAIHLRRR